MKQQANGWKLVISILMLLGIGAGGALWNHESRISKCEMTIMNMAKQTDAIYSHLLGTP